MDTTIHLPLDVMENLKRYANSKGMSPEDAVTGWAKTLIPTVPLLEPHDEWERKLRSIPRRTGVALTDEDLSSEGIYD